MQNASVTNPINFINLLYIRVVSIPSVDYVGIYTTNF